MFSVLLTCLVVIAIIMVGVILLQKSEGSGISGSQAASMFGGALTGASAGNFLTKLTAWLATIFFVICAVLAFIVARQGKNVTRSLVREELIKAEAFGTPADKKAGISETSKTAPSQVVPEGVAAKTQEDFDDSESSDESEILKVPKIPKVPEN